MGYFLLAASHAGASSNGTLVAALLAALTLVPGLGAMYVSLRARSDKSHQVNLDNKKDLVALGANILSEEIERLTKERKSWEDERLRWMEDKADLLQKVNYLSSQLDDLNRYVIQVLTLLYAHDLEPPLPPKSLRLNGSNGHGKKDV